MKFRIHVLGIPHTRTNLDYTACAYTQKAYKFCKMMHDRGHYIMHYGVEGSNPECDENVNVVSNEIYEKVYGGHDFHSNLFQYSMSDECYQTFYKNAIKEIGKRKQPNDIILPFWGQGVKPICDAFPDLIVIEPGIGYTKGAWAKYRVYESYSIFAEQTAWDEHYNDPSWYHVIIPNYFDLDDFEYNPNSRTDVDEPYFAFIGRIGDYKGVNIAMQVTAQLGVKLKVAGQIDEYRDYKWPENVEFIGYCNKEQRADLLKGAVASFVASRYLEPFGGVQIEALLCGTPTITTDWGAFPENNINGVTGYRCRTYDDFVNAAINCYEGKIKQEDCRKQGEKFSLENVAPRYEKFFEDVLNLYTTKEGWYKLKDSTKERVEKFKNRKKDI